MNLLVPCTFFISILVSGCAHPQRNLIDEDACHFTSQGFSCPLTKKKYKDDLVSVQSTVELAFQSYVQGCVLASCQQGTKDSLENCMAKGRKHVKETVIFILDQDPKPIPSSGQPDKRSVGP